ncbi:MAG: xanthine dehydrogenase accessory protein XdhC [Rhodobacteraceae bacterium]|nr:xanthine dehydrogenase accessory protein XdhC [Paracoccaceae bacterium]
MAFDLDDLCRAVEQHGRVARVVIAEVHGSSPRDVGTAMLVWQDGQSGTIGGGALEYEATRAARHTMETSLTWHALGPGLGQCCGGSVGVLTEIFHAANLPDGSSGLVARPVAPGATMPLSVKRITAAHRSQGLQPDPVLIDGWMVEPVQDAARPLWIWGAGHVGRAIVNVLAPLPDFAVTWVDTTSDRFPHTAPQHVSILPAARPGRLVAHAPTDAEHLILTYSHELDLDLCHQLLSHSFCFAGLIGSRTKWARFRSRLRALGHADARIARITCPIGQPSLGKHPQMIAIGVAATLVGATVHQSGKKGRIT